MRLQSRSRAAALATALANTVPPAEHCVPYGVQCDGASNHLAQLGIRICIGGGEWRNVDGIPNRLIAAGVDDIAECLLGILDAPALRVSIPQVNQLLLLASPQATDALPIQLDHPEAQTSLREANNAILIRAILHHVPQG